ncbi:filamentous hemagglutinin N-terminal domain-containing protein, partial [Marinomonas agarivorans]
MSSSLLTFCRRHQRSIAQITLAFYITLPGVVLAETVTDVANQALIETGGNHAPVLDQSANGVTVIKINKASAGGVSRNSYERFNVDSKGVIFNNATKITKTDLAGYIEGNARLGGQSAKIILNEVLGNDRSMLNGYMEIAGQKAQLVIANRRGVTCNGCGFINTTRGVLTTGEAIFEGNKLDRFVVSDGDVLLEGAGLNSPDTEYVDILARSIKLNGELWANNATLVTGQNKVDYARDAEGNLDITKLTPEEIAAASSTPSTPSFALDVAAIGGMYANRITLIGTEKGLGVNFGGNVVAAEDMTLLADGRLVNKATLKAENIAINSNGLENHNDSHIGADENLTIRTTNELTNKGKLIAGNTLNIDSANVSNADTGDIHADQAVSLTLQDKLVNQGQLSSSGDVSIKAATVENSDSAQLQSSQSLRIDTNQLDNAGNMVAADQLHVQAQSVQNQQTGIMQANEVQLQLAKQAVNKGTIEAYQALVLEAQSLTNTTGAKLQTSGDLTVTIDETANNAGVIRGQNLNLTAENLTNTKTLQAEKDLNLTLQGDLTNSGELVTNETLTLNTANIHNTAPSLIQGKNANITSAGTVENEGQMLFDDSVEVQAKKLANKNGAQLVAKETLSLTLDEMLDNAGLVDGKNIDLVANSLINTSTVQATNDLTATLSEHVDNQGDIKANQTIEISTNHLTNNQEASVQAGNALSLDLNGDLTNKGLMSSDKGALTVKAKGILNTGSLAGNSVALKGNTITNQGDNGFLYGATQVDIQASKDINNHDGAVILSLGDANLKASDTLTNSSASIDVAKDLSIDATNILNKKRVFVVEDKVEVTNKPSHNVAPPSGSYSAVRTYTRTITTPTVVEDSAQGQIVSGGDMSLTGNIRNHYSTISAGGNLNFIADIFENLSAVGTIKNEAVGTDTLKSYYQHCYKKFFKRRCKTKTSTSHRPYNEVVNTSKDLALATFSAGGTIKGKAGTLANVGAVKTNGSTQALQTTVNVSGTEVAKKPVDALSLTSQLIEYEHDLSFVEQSALFHFAKNPNKGYLIETNPAFADYDRFISSDYLLERLGVISTGKGQKAREAIRIGNGFLEQKLIKDQLIAFTGKPNLPHYDNIEELYKNLMRNALDVHENLSLKVGITLTKAQIKQLNKPIVWMVEQTVQMPNGPVTALAPKLFFPNPDDFVLRRDGSLIAANNIDIDVTGEMHNSGQILAETDLSIDSGSITNSGTLAAGENANLTTEDDFINRSGQISAGDNLAIRAGGDFISETQSEILNHSNTSTINETIKGVFGSKKIATTSYNTQSTQTLVGETASIGATNVTIQSGGDMTFTGSELSATDTLELHADRDVSFNAVDIVNSRSNNRDYRDASMTHQVSTVDGDKVNISTGKLGTVLLEGTQVAANDALSIDAGYIDLVAVKDTSDYYSFTGKGGNTTKIKNHNESLTATNLDSEGTLSLNAKGDIYSEGSALSANEGIELVAGGDITLGVATANQSAYKQVKTKVKGTFGSKRTTTTTSSKSTTNQGTELTSTGDINIVSGNDLTLVASTVKTTDGDIDVDAEGDVNLLAAVDQTSSRYQYEKKGSFRVKNKDQGSVKQTAVESALIAESGDIAVSADKNITLEGATLDADETLSLGADGDALVAVVKNASLNGSVDYVNEAGEAIGNILVKTKALFNEEWSQSSSSFRGIAKDLVKGLSTIVSVASLGAIHGEITIGEAHETRRQERIHKTATLVANDLEIDAQNDVTFVGTDVQVANNATINANDVIFDAAQNQIIESESHTKTTISSEGASYNDETGEATVVSVSETDHTQSTTTNATTWQGTNLSAGNLTINANNDVNIIASDITVQDDLDINAQNTLISGREDTVETTNETITDTKTFTVGVKNAYADVLIAAQNLKKAKEAVSAAKDAYQTAKQQVKDGILPKSDLDFYLANIAAAELSRATAIAAMGNAGKAAATAAAAGGTGFYASIGSSFQRDKTTTTTTQGNWNGSSINVGGNASIDSDDNLTVKGSDVNVAGT